MEKQETETSTINLTYFIWFLNIIYLNGFYYDILNLFLDIYLYISSFFSFHITCNVLFFLTTSSLYTTKTSSYLIFLYVLLNDTISFRVHSYRKKILFIIRSEKDIMFFFFFFFGRGNMLFKWNKLSFYIKWNKD